jgi:hypothetical protein
LGAFLSSIISLIETRMGAVFLLALLCTIFNTLGLTLSGKVGPAPSFLLNLLSQVVLMASAATVAALAVGTAPGAVPSLSKPPPGLQACLLLVFRKTAPLALVAAVFFVLLLLMSLALAVGIALYSAALSEGKGLASLLYLLPPAAAFLSTGFLYGCLSLSAPSCALERRGPFASLARSFRLVRGCKLSIAPVFCGILAARLAAVLTIITASPPLWRVADIALNMLTLAAIGALYQSRLKAFPA